MEIDHTISNITSTTGNGVIIGQLSGTVRNLYAEHISKTNTGTHNGLIGYTASINLQLLKMFMFQILS